MCLFIVSLAGLKIFGGCFGSCYWVLKFVVVLILSCCLYYSIPKTVQQFVTE